MSDPRPPPSQRENALLRDLLEELGLRFIRWEDYGENPVALVEPPPGDVLSKLPDRSMAILPLPGRHRSGSVRIIIHSPDETERRPAEEVSSCAQRLHDLDDSLDLYKRIANRRGAQLRQIVRAFNEGTLRIGDPIPAPMAEVQPTDLVDFRLDKDRTRWVLIEASGPSFRGSLPDQQPHERGWSVHFIDLASGGSMGGSWGATGGEIVTVRRLLHGLGTWVHRWTCPTCLFENVGDECSGCGTTRTERAIYAKHVREGVDQ